MREWSQFGQLAEMLDPFLEATCLTEGEQVVTISYVLPSVLSLVRYLQDIKPRLKHCNPLCNALLSSLHQRFRGMLHRLHLSTTDCVNDVAHLPYSSDIYIIATFF